MKLKITIIGKVHDVGYRPFLFDAASIFNIPYFEARNVLIDNRQAVIVLVDDNSVQKFVRYIRSTKPPQAIVEDIIVEEYDGGIKKIGDYKDVLMINQLNKIVQVGLMMLQKQDLMLEKQDLMLGKQDETIEKIDETKYHLSEKIDNVSEKIDLLRSDLKSYMESRFNNFVRCGF